MLYEVKNESNVGRNPTGPVIAPGQSKILDISPAELAEIGSRPAVFSVTPYEPDDSLKTELTDVSGIGDSRAEDIIEALKENDQTIEQYLESGQAEDDLPESVIPDLIHKFLEA